jgi:EAL domain-containing protein (putative c-di-GMP-specific phosphodiesterase class I)
MSKIDEKYIIDNFNKALENGYIKTYFQPIIRTLTGDICCCRRQMLYAIYRQSFPY